MLKLTRQTDYAIVLVARLAELPPDRVLSAREAAEWTGLSLPMVSKILKGLARAGLVGSQRGVGGGYALAVPADEVTVAAVVRALEGPISVVDCAAGAGNCEHELGCPVRVNWSRINREIEATLERIPVSQMVTPSRPTPLLTLGTESAGASEE